jgi:hypothetical protein
MYNLEFKKSIINIHEYFQNNNYSNNEFLNMIDKCFNIKKTTFYNWSSDDNIINSNIIFENNNKLVNTAVEIYIGAGASFAYILFNEKYICKRC